MKWSEISISTTQDAIDTVANILYDAGAGGVIIEDSDILTNEFKNEFGELYELSSEDYPNEGVIIKAYYPYNRYLVETVKQIRLSINDLSNYDLDIGSGKISISEIEDEDWATSWKKYYKPIKVSNRFTISPTWEKFEIDGDGLLIELDPGMAFGTGTHPTTIMSIQALEKVITGNEQVIDVGCGTGILSIAAAKLGANSILALDLDEIAVKSAKLNAKINNVDEKIEVKQNNLINDIDINADVIVANILAEIIIQFTGDVYKLLNPNGFFIASGIINTKADLVKTSIEEAGLIIIDEIKDQDWVTYISKKP